MRLPTALLFAGLLAAGSARAQAIGQTGPNAGYDPQSVTAPAGGYDPNHHIEVPGQGAQDPARAEVLEGRSRDMPRCKATLLARRETEAEATEVCNKILYDLGE